MWKRLAAWWDLSEDVRTLRDLDDRMLEDMGLARAQIRSRVMGRAGAGPAKASTPLEPWDGPEGEAVPWRGPIEAGPECLV